MDDLVTGATTEVEVAVEAPPERVWDTLSDMTRIGEWSPECVWAAWLDDAEHPPKAGDRFEARNEYGDGAVSTVECVVTEADRPYAFAWVVLDDGRDVSRPGSIWRYALRPEDGGTVVRHTFTHGPGMTGLREGAAKRPEAIERRLAHLRRNMVATLTAMTAGMPR